MHEAKFYPSTNTQQQDQQLEQQDKIQTFKPFKCTICNAAFTWIALNNHEIIKHGMTTVLQI